MTTDSLTLQVQQLETDFTRYNRSDVAAAQRIAEQALAITAGAGHVARALALRIYANHLRTMGRVGEALRQITQAQRLFQAAGAEVEWARTITAAIPILVGLDRNAEAVRSAKQALALLLRNNELTAAGRLLNNMGAMYGNMGRPRLALDCFARSEALSAQTGQADLAVRAQANQALVLQQLGRHQESLTVCARALRFWHKQKAPVSVAKTLQTGAIGLFHLGRFGKALRRFARARDLFATQASPRDVAVCDLYLAACYLELNRYDQTIIRTRTVLEVLDPVENGFQHAWAHLYEGAALARSGRPAEARRLLARACAWFSDRGHSAWAGKARLEEADLLRSGGDAAAASKAATAAAKLFAAAHMQTEAARAQLLRAEACLAAGRVQAAAQAADLAYPTLSRSHMPGPTFRCLHLQGRIALRQRRLDEARRLLTRAVATAERMRATVQLSFRRTFLDDKSSAYADLVWVLLQQGRSKQAHRLADQAKSRALADELAALAPSRYGVAATGEDLALRTRIERTRRAYQDLTAPLQFGPEQAIALRGGAAVSIPAQRAQLEAELAALWDAWQLRHLGAAPANTAAFSAGQRLPQGVAMVEYFAAGDHLVAFVSDRRGLRGWTDLGDPETVRQTLQKLQLNLDTTMLMAASGHREAPGLVRNARALLETLYQVLWAPLEPLLAGRQQVVIIPHGMLHLVPFEALHDGRQHLVQRLEVSLAPSRAVWFRCQERAAAVPAGAGDLVMGYDPGGALPYVEREARLVAGALAMAGAAGAAHTGPAATSARLAAAGPCRVVHLAAHGEFREENPHFSTLHLADGPLTVADVASLRLPASLVTLSGCETGLSRVTRGEELMGMIAAFLQAGSASVLASRWRIDDALTADLMDRFYAHLLAGRDKAAALRAAQSSFAAEDRHPLYWAAFGLIGHSGPISGEVPSTCAAPPTN